MAMMIMSLFVVSLYGLSTGFNAKYNISENDLGTEHLYVGEDNQSIFEELNIIGEGKSSIADMAQKSPGGSEATQPEESATTEGNLVQSGWQMVITAGSMLFTLPYKLIYAFAEFLQLPTVFVTVAFTAILLTAATLLVSSLLKNRL